MNRQDATLLMIVENELEHIERTNPRLMLHLLELFGDGKSLWAQQLRLRVAVADFKAELYKLFVPILDWLADVIKRVKQATKR